MLETYMDLLNRDVHACYELNYRAVTEHFQDIVRLAGEAPPAGLTHVTDEEIASAVDLLRWGEPPASDTDGPAVRRWPRG